MQCKAINLRNNSELTLKRGTGPPLLVTLLLKCTLTLLTTLPIAFEFAPMLLSLFLRAV